jgi:LuxR family transcriptional regulator, maltose regulon positive regulatory protein
MGDGGDDGWSPVLIETKLRAPAVPAQSIPRERLFDQLRRGSGRRLTLVACPAGFGKTTLLAAWRETEAPHRPVAWLALDKGDNDPAVLWAYIIDALGRVCPAIGQSAALRRTRTSSITGVVLPHLVNELLVQGEVTLVLDDFHELGDGPSRATIAWLIDHAPPSFQLVLSTRSEPGFPVAALRARGVLNELRADDLRFTSEEARALLNDRLNLGLTTEDIDVLVERMEGWPAGLYLTALSLMRTADRNALVTDLATTSRHVIDFLETEVLEAHDPPMQELMLRSSVLKRLSGSLCDAVMGKDGSAVMLAELSRSNLFLVPLEGDDSWYRFHPLFRKLLRVELRRREPDLSVALHRRAYGWFRDHGMTEEAISHAIEAGAFAEAAELIEASWVSYANSARYDTVLAWIRRFPSEMRSTSAGLLLAEAWMLALSARKEETQRAIAAVERLGNLSAGPLACGFRSAESALAILRAAVPWGDVGGQLRNGRHAVELEGPESAVRPMACWAMGMGLYYGGEPAEADRWFAESAGLAPASAQWLAGASSLAYRSLIAGERGCLEEQRVLAEQAAQVVREHDTERANGAVTLALGVSLAARGRPDEALPMIDRGLAFMLRGRGQPTEVAMALLHQRAVLRALGERERSRAVIIEARFIIESCPDPGMLTERLRISGECPQPSIVPYDETLTPGETRILQLLTGDLSQRDIGRELYVTSNTVHTHVKSIYRKLGVSTRATAIRRARDLGLLQSAARAKLPAAS